MGSYAKASMEGTMTDLIDLLSEFNRKERFFLVSEALGNEGRTDGFTLGPYFRRKLGRAIGVEVPCSALAWMDYHLDWIAASLRAHKTSGYLRKTFCNPGQLAVTGTPQDTDLLIAFKAGNDYHLVLLEAKGDDNWGNDQLKKKSEQLKEIFGTHGDEHPNVKPYFCLMSPREPEKVKPDGWPTWMWRTGRNPYYWLKLDLPRPRLHVTRCDACGKSSAEGDYFCIEERQ